MWSGDRYYRRIRGGLPAEAGAHRSGHNHDDWSARISNEAAKRFKPNAVGGARVDDVLHVGLHNLLSQVGLEEKVIPVLVDLFPEKERLKMHAALRLHGGIRFTFLQATSFTPTHMDFVLDNLRTEMVAVKGAPHLKMFSKTDYSKVKTWVKITKIPRDFSRRLGARTARPVVRVVLLRGLRTYVVLKRVLRP